MAQALLFGIGSGLVAAAIIAAVFNGGAFALLLANFAPLPITIATLATKHVAGLIAAASGATVIYAALGSSFAIAFVLILALPAWLFGYLTLLARAGSAGVEWFPVERIVLLVGIIGGLAALGAIIAMVVAAGGSFDDPHAAIAALVDAFMRQDGLAGAAGEPGPGGPDTGGLDTGGPGNSDRAALIAAALPPAFAAGFATTHYLNLVIGALVVRRSGRLARPWPDLAALALPKGSGLLFGVLFAASFLPAPVGVAAQVLAAGVAVAFAMVGLATVHAGTRGVRARGFILFGVYALAVIQPWTLVLLALLGLAEQAFGIRARLAAGSSPSS